MPTADKRTEGPRNADTPLRDLLTGGPKAADAKAGGMEAGSMEAADPKAGGIKNAGPRTGGTAAGDPPAGDANADDRKAAYPEAGGPKTTDTLTDRLSAETQTDRQTADTTPDEAIRFENRIAFTARTLRPAYRELMPRWLRGLYGLFLATGAAGLLFTDFSTDEFPLAALLLAIVALSGLLRPCLQARMAARNHRAATHGQTAEAVIRYTESQIAGLEARNRFFYSYEQIHSVRSTRHLWLLMIDRGIALIVDKEGFTRGRPSDFPAFIRSKCPGIKGTFK